MFSRGYHKKVQKTSNPPTDVKVPLTFLRARKLYALRDKGDQMVHFLFFIRTRKFQSRLDVLKFSLRRVSYVLIMFLKCSKKNGAEAQCS